MGPFETYVREKYTLTRSLASTTEGHYIIAAKQMDKFLSSARRKKLDVKATTPDLLSQFVKWYESKVSSANTVRTKRTILIAIVNHALEPEQRVINSKFVRLPKPQKTVKDSWSPEQVSILVQVASAIPGVLSIGTTRGEYAACLISVAFETAARRGDLTRITTKDALSGRPFQFVQNKTQHVTSFVVSAATQDRIRQMSHVRKRSKFVFKPWGEYHLECITRLASTAMKRAGLSASDGCLKKLRRSSITEAERLRPGTGYIQGGHTTPTVTVENYIDPSRAYQDMPRPSLPQIGDGNSN